MGELDFVLGPMVIGTACSLLLCGILITQCYLYFIRYPRDPTWMKAMVGYFLVADFLHTLIETACVYIYTVTLFGDFVNILNTNWVFSLIPVTTVLISSTAQTFFAWRVYKLTESLLLGIVIAVFAFIQLLCGIGVTIAVTLVKSFLDFHKFQALVILWLVLSMVCDFIITGSLTWYLHKNRSGMPSTNDIVTKIIRLTLQTGAITALWATLDLIIFLNFANSLHLLFNFPLAKMYTNSLMSTLNARTPQVTENSGNTITGASKDASGWMKGLGNAASGRGGRIPSSRGRGGVGLETSAEMPVWDRTAAKGPINIITTTSVSRHHDRDGDTDTSFMEHEEGECYELEGQKAPPGEALSKFP
ncbi:hypothetical protein SISNIDRAFT_488621 [Sistotremastrum niveocremeum HHB9708]|uniref:DUF6534 domain-containing protein n=1 Tax=Sistotremastrum niveocremeum HHB9708 TaxID=1314777 RepID=A0A164QYN0_9AGAM|nr:hypothetical protein SISNIDRAFT_488621 [Sistotremastrum niveocremeum HHB9708]